MKELAENLAILLLDHGLILLIHFDGALWAFGICLNSIEIISEICSAET